ncbi:hypothetical protein JHL17_22370 [Azospirillum sp. YIM B02556]|uniref:Uncharacterized protein n=1 Tax=Azospirillum endophyticum TaxID=2800326 RepID=A0ABS1F9Q7_9PROT|nr:hypothetical protein [Azospirillum endophyticum]MBK1840156.1 hypothetical protein [Azospirillum endophyticum]
MSPQSPKNAQAWSDYRRLQMVIPTKILNDHREHGPVFIVFVIRGVPVFHFPARIFKVYRRAAIAFSDRIPYPL